MKNIPEKIYLQLGEDIGEDFKEHHEVSWCVDKIYDTDLEYVSIERIAKLTADRDDFETQLIAAKLKIEKMKLIEYDKWIRLKDKFPEYNINVLALSKKGEIRIACVGSDGELDNFELEIDNGEDYYTHWRYLPNKLG